MNGVFHERKFVDLALEAVEEDGTFSGYASLFGKVDLSGDVIDKGAFARSIAKRGNKGVRLLYQHDPSKPVGTWLKLKEDATGLFVRGRLTLGTQLAEDVHKLMRAGALDGLSIGFQTMRARKDVPPGVRRILEADLWEISIVTFPMQPQARIRTVKTRVMASPPGELIKIIRHASNTIKRGTTYADRNH
ncbi:HK97 family phage prohead protease [Limoniibacter endophyticus]|uniref:Primosomal replication protein N n=1 Tax=Limoniibacter endophyticus TaxID=1565040 RepID=A0A8J3DGK2_9HYPH|nr:HK97 family phage prohead protease [Limoniibacter endophyticus]GHC69342.1 primosomal replication protein N [Limoniibacter endophyticus]